MIISPSKRAALVLLAEVWEHCPDIRLGQLFTLLGELGEDDFGHVLYDIEDDEMIATLARHLGELKARLPGELFAEQAVEPATTSPT